MIETPVKFFSTTGILIGNVVSASDPELMKSKGKTLYEVMGWKDDRCGLYDTDANTMIFRFDNRFVEFEI